MGLYGTFNGTFNTIFSKMKKLRNYEVEYKVIDKETKEPKTIYLIVCDCISKKIAINVVKEKIINDGDYTIEKLIGVTKVPMYYKNKVFKNVKIF